MRSETDRGFEESELDKRVEDEITRFERLLNYDGADKMVTSLEFQSQKEKEKESVVRHYSGFAELDFFLDGFAEGEVVVITGLFGNGKTLFSQSLIRAFVANEIPCAVFSYEVPTLQFLEPFKADNFLHEKLIVPRANSPYNGKWLEERIIEAKVKHDCKIVLIDHLHFLVEMSSENMSTNIGSIMRRLAVLAQLERIVILIVCHQKSLGDAKYRSEPALDLCRDSSAIPQECRIGLVVNRMKDKNEQGQEFDSYDQGFCWVKIDKATRKGTYKKKLTFQKRGNWLEPV
jgi:archaellum biogenesis ATPase FlaH